MNAIRILGIIGGLGLAGALLWSFYLKSTPMPERTFERGLPAEAQQVKKPATAQGTENQSPIKPAAKIANDEAKTDTGVSDQARGKTGLKKAILNPAPANADTPQDETPPTAPKETNTQQN